MNISITKIIWKSVSFTCVIYEVLQTGFKNRTHQLLRGYNGFQRLQKKIPCNRTSIEHDPSIPHVHFGTSLSASPSMGWHSFRQYSHKRYHIFAEKVRYGVSLVSWESDSYLTFVDILSCNICYDSVISRFESMRRNGTFTAARPRGVPFTPFPPDTYFIWRG